MTTTRPPSSEELAERLRATTRLYAALLVATVLTVLVPLPLRLTGIGFGLLAIVVGFRLLFALARARRDGGRAGGFVGVSVGLGLASVLVVVNLVLAAFYPTVYQLERCQSTASTIAARERCAEQFQPRFGPATTVRG